MQVTRLTSLLFCKLSVLLWDKEMSLDLETFVAALTVSELNGLTKASLLTVALYYKLSTTDSMTKTQLKKLVLQYLQCRNRDG